jgi:hypothetical protein
VSPQILLGKRYCTGGAGGTDGPHRVGVQFQQHRAWVAPRLNEKI